MLGELCQTLKAHAARQYPRLAVGAAPAPVEAKAACLLVLHAESHPHLVAQRHPLGDECSIGRADGNSITLPSAAVSRHHARIERDDQGFTWVDLQSTNGSFVAGDPEPVSRRRLVDGDRIAVGDAILSFCCAPDLEEKYRAQLAYLGEQDALTRCKTRSAFHAETARAVLLARAEQRALSVLVLSLDTWFELSRTDGALAGNALLAGVAEQTVASVPEGSFVGRCGVAGLAVTLPGVDTRAALAFAEQLRLRIEAQRFRVLRSFVSTTVSVGASTLYRTTGVDELIADAEVALDRARRAGQNRVVGPSEEAAA
jgi:diguanylate cyclase (GGDEF)-like protein